MHANMSAHIWVMRTGLRRQRQSFCRSCNACWYIAVEREPRWASELHLSVGTHTKDSVWGGSNWIYASLVPLRPTPAPILQILPLFLTLLSFISPLSARRSWLQETHGTYVCRCRQIWACHRHMLWHVTTSLVARPRWLKTFNLKDISPAVSWEETNCLQHPCELTSALVLKEMLRFCLFEIILFMLPHRIQGITHTPVRRLGLQICS